MKQKKDTHKSTDGGAANTERNVSLRPFPLRVGHRMMDRTFLSDKGKIKRVSVPFNTGPFLGSGK